MLNLAPSMRQDSWNEFRDYLPPLRRMMAQGRSKKVSQICRYSLEWMCACFVSVELFRRGWGQQQEHGVSGQAKEINNKNVETNQISTRLPRPRPFNAEWPCRSSVGVHMSELELQLFSIGGDPWSRIICESFFDRE